MVRVALGANNHEKATLTNQLVEQYGIFLPGIALGQEQARRDNSRRAFFMPYFLRQIVLSGVAGSLPVPLT
jgi:hypothetical protein